MESLGSNARNRTRRQVLSGALGALAATSLTSCDAFSTDPSGEGGDGSAEGGGRKGKEAPALADQVEAGTLPPLEERIPANPRVVEPVEEVGAYGGTWDTTIMSASADAYEYVGYDPLVRWDRNFTMIVPGLADWEISDDGRTYTFTILDGLRWSDGENFTSDDVVFVFDDVLSNTELFPDFPSWLAVDGEPGTIEKVDETTFTMSFVEPNGLLLAELASPDAAILTTVPRHHFEQFHKTYTPEVDQLAEDEGFSTWADLFGGRGGLGITDLGWWQSPEIPTVTPWIVTSGLSGDATNRITCERNPYYWKVDPDGSQLPYIDRVNIHLVEEPNTLVLQISEGRYSLPSQDVETPDNKTTIATNREVGDYRLIDLTTSDTNYTTIVFNQTCKDPALREVFRNKDFRIGLSHAINRPEVVKVVYLEQGEPWQVAPLPEGPFYDEELAKQYTEFDLDLANEHLDRAGAGSKGWARLSAASRRPEVVVQGHLARIRSNVARNG